MAKIEFELKTDREILVALAENSNTTTEDITEIKKHLEKQNTRIDKNCRKVRDLRIVLITIVIVTGTFLGFQVPIILGG